jgi:hypothetical protein
MGFQLASHRITGTIDQPIPICCAKQALCGLGKPGDRLARAVGRGASSKLVTRKLIGRVARARAALIHLATGSFSTDLHHENGFADRWCRRGIRGVARQDADLTPDTGQKPGAVWIERSSVNRDTRDRLSAIVFAPKGPCQSKPVWRRSFPEHEKVGGQQPAVRRECVRQSVADPRELGLCPLGSTAPRNRRSGLRRSAMDRSKKRAARSERSRNPCSGPAPASTRSRRYRLQQVLPPVPRGAR